MENNLENQETLATPQRAANSETLVMKGAHGWVARTMVYDVNGYDWKVSTSKSDQGMIKASAQAGKSTSPTSFSCLLIGDPSVELHTVRKRATEKSVREVHQLGLERFDAMLEQGELPVNKSKEEDIKVGQVIFMANNSQDEHHHDRLVVYDTFDSPVGTHFEYVNIETFKLGRATEVRNIEEKFGIGFYYKKGDTVSIEELTSALNKAKALEKEEAQRIEAKTQKEADEYQRKVSEGMKLVNVPKDAQAIIIGRLVDGPEGANETSDYQSNTKLIYLAYSTHTKNLFSELRSASRNAMEVHHLIEAPKSWEHRNKPSSGIQYSLRAPYSGWEVTKITLKQENASTLEKLAIAAYEGRYCCEVSEPVNQADFASVGFHPIQETMHTKKGHQLFVVELEERVDRPTYDAYLEKAKENNGYYSGYRRDGAIPGFQFKTMEEAEKFVQVIVDDGSTSELKAS